MAWTNHLARIVYACIFATLSSSAIAGPTGDFCNEFPAVSIEFDLKSNGDVNGITWHENPDPVPCNSHLHNLHSRIHESLETNANGGDWWGWMGGFIGFVGSYIAYDAMAHDYQDALLDALRRMDEPPSSAETYRFTRVDYGLQETIERICASVGINARDYLG